MSYAGGPPPPAPPPPASYSSAPLGGSQTYYGGQATPNGQPQWQQAQGQGQQAAVPTGQAPPAAAPSGEVPATNQPGFFARMLKRGQKPGPAAGEIAPSTNSSGQNQQQQGQPQQQQQQQQQQQGQYPQQQPQKAPTGVEEVKSAGCLPSKPLTPDQVDELRRKPLGKSRFPCLNNASGAHPPSGAPGGQQHSSMPMTTPSITGPAPECSVFGPFLKFGGFDPVARYYKASVLVIAHQARCPTPPILFFRDLALSGQEAQVTAVHLDHYQGWNFWRFNLTVECGTCERKVEYYVKYPTDHAFSHHARHRYVVPALNQKWHWGFYSCNGFHDPQMEIDAGGIQPLWRDVLQQHQQKPFHVMLGGGDQLYNDDVWKCPSLVTWCKLQDSNSRHAHPFTQDMINQVLAYYFNSYVKQWSQPEFGDALATIPQVMVWDDHDIFDGWGSYPDYLQNCPVFQGVYFIARKFYGLFQQHTTVEKAAEYNDVFGVHGWNFITCMGPSTAVVSLDSRTERTPFQILHPQSWAMVQSRLAALPSTVRHVIILTTVPVIYPKLPAVESALAFMAGAGRSRWGVVQMLQKSGLAESLISQFGTVEILDDLMDHWNADTHQIEKLQLVHMMQALSLSRGFRFTIVSGDVHVAGVGRFMSHPKKNLKSDHRYIPQIISSAIGNLPPPAGVIKALTAASKPLMLDRETKECMVNVFGVRKVLYAARNWVQVTEQGNSRGSLDSVLTFQFRVEPPGRHGTRPEVYEVQVPSLDLPVGARVGPYQPIVPVGALPSAYPSNHLPLTPVSAPYPQSYQQPYPGIPPIGQGPPQNAGQPYSGPPQNPGPTYPGQQPYTAQQNPGPSLTYPGPPQTGQAPGNTGKPGPLPGSPAWLLNQSATPGTFMPQSAQQYGQAVPPQPPNQYGPGSAAAPRVPAPGTTTASSGQPPYTQARAGAPQQYAPPPGGQQQYAQAPPAGQQQYAQAPPAGQQQYAQAPPAGQQQYAQASPPGGQQQYAQAPPPGGQQQYAQAPPPGGQQYAQAPPRGQQQQYAQAPPPGQQQQYAQAPPPGQQQQYAQAPPPGGQQYAQAPPPGQQQQYAQAPPPGQQQQYAQAPPPGGQQYAQAPPPGQQQQYAQAPPAGGQQQYAQAPPAGGQQQYAQAPPPGQQQYAQAPPPGQQQQYAQAPPAGQQQYAQAPPAGQQQYAQAPAPGQQQYAQAPPAGQQQYAQAPPPGQQQYAQAPPAGQQQYAQAPPPGQQQYAQAPPPGGQQQYAPNTAQPPSQPYYSQSAPPPLPQRVY